MPRKHGARTTSESQLVDKRRLANLVLQNHRLSQRDHLGAGEKANTAECDKRDASRPKTLVHKRGKDILDVEDCSFVGELHHTTCLEQLPSPCPSSGKEPRSFYAHSEKDPRILTKLQHDHLCLPPGPPSGRRRSPPSPDLGLPGPWGTLTAAIEELDCVQAYCEGETAYCMHWVPLDSYDTQTAQFMNGDEVAGIVRTEIGEC